MFQETLNIYELGSTYTSGEIDYRRVHKWYERLRKKVITFYQQNNLTAQCDNFKCILSYFLAVFLEIYETKTVSTNLLNSDYSRFLSNCFHNSLQLSRTKTGKHYKLTINPNDMSVFLCLFKPDSEITQKLGYQLTKEQNDGIERLIENTTLTPEGKFQELMLLFYRKN